MRVLIFILLNVLAIRVWADEFLWETIRTEANLVVLMRHARPAGGNPLIWDTSGNCLGESMLTEDGKAHARKIGEEFAKRSIAPIVISSPMCRCRDTARFAFGTEVVTDAALREIASADPGTSNAFERRAQKLIAGYRGTSPLVFVSHRPNIDQLTLELVSEGELIVTRANSNGELNVIGKLHVRP